MKKSILYCEDQENFRTDFIRRHENDFEVDTIPNVQDCIIHLKSLKKLPDLLLLDLYHPKDIINQEEVASLAAQQLQELTKKIREVKKFVDEAWEPIGIEALYEIRRHYPAHKLPVLIYTQRGLFLLEDDKLRALEKLDADWLIKDKERITPTTESIRIRRYIEKCKASRRPARDILIAFIFTIIGVALSMLFAN